MAYIAWDLYPYKTTTVTTATSLTATSGWACSTDDWLEPSPPVPGPAPEPPPDLWDDPRKYKGQRKGDYWYRRLQGVTRDQYRALRSKKRKQVKSAQAVSKKALKAQRRRHAKKLRR